MFDYVCASVRVHWFSLEIVFYKIRFLYNGGKNSITTTATTASFKTFSSSNFEPVKLIPVKHNQDTDMTQLVSGQSDKRTPGEWLTRKPAAQKRGFRLHNTVKLCDGPESNLIFIDDNVPKPFHKMYKLSPILIVYAFSLHKLQKKKEENIRKKMFSFSIKAWIR